MGAAVLSHGHVPGSCLDTTSTLASPQTFWIDRWFDWLASVAAGPAMVGRHPFHEMFAGPESRVLVHAGDTGVALQHVGVLVGSSAHRHLWPEILAWIDAQSD